MIAATGENDQARIDLYSPSKKGKRNKAWETIARNWVAQKGPSTN
jgi:hypothetical protein